MIENNIKKIFFHSLKNVKDDFIILFVKYATRIDLHIQKYRFSKE